MSILDPFVDHLAEAAERLAAQPAAGGARARLRARFASMRRGRIAMFAAAAALLAGGTVAAATELWRPQLGDDRRGHPTASASSPPAEQLDRFGVLRRSPTDADRSAEVRYALSLFGPRGVKGIRSDHVRLVGTHGAGLGDVLVPAARAHGKRDALCLFSRDPVDGGGVICHTTDEILAGRAVMMIIDPPAPGAAAIPRPAPAVEGGGPATGGPPGSIRKARGGTMVIPTPSGPATLLGLVPDGVVRVRQGGVTADVHDNAFRLTIPHEMEPTVQWLDADGVVVEPRRSALWTPGRG